MNEQAIARRLLVALFAIISCLPAPAASPGPSEEQPLIEWRFDAEGDMRGWTTGGHIRNAHISDGALLGEISDWDPILIGPLFEIAATPTQSVEIKMQTPRGGSAQLFWTQTEEGPYHGFSEQKSCHFETRSGESFQVYRIDPFWHAAGKIIRLRLDPPATGPFAVEWIRIVDTGIPVSTAAKSWRFEKDTFGWRIWRDLSEPVISGNCLHMTSEGQSPILISPRLSIPAKNHHFVSLRMATKQGSSGRILCVSDTQFGREEISFPIRADGKFHSYNIEVGHLEHWRDQIILLGVQPTDGKKASVWIESIEITDSPRGPVELEIDYFGATGGILRAGRPAEVIATVRNLGGDPAKNIRATLELPGNVRVIGPCSQTIESITHATPRTIAWQLESARPEPAQISLKIDGAPIEPITSSAVFDFTPCPNISPGSYIPEPQPVPSEYDIGVFYFPGWPSMTRWQPILNYPNRKPVLGWYDESNPECADWQIKWAVEHGIKFFMVDWYWCQGNRQLEHWLHDAYMKAKFRKYLQWSVMWANHNPPGTHSLEDWRNVTQYWIDHYFGMDAYYRIDGRPAVFLWDPAGIRHDVGGSEKAASLYALSQKMARDAGFPGIYFVAMSSHESEASCRQLKKEGYEAFTSYHAFQIAAQRAGSKRFPFADVVATSSEVWREADARAAGLLYMPIVDTGWSAEPWHGNKSLVITDRTPDQFGKLCHAAREYASQTQKKIITIGPCNEWGEGSYIEPYAEYGFQDLDQLRAAFCPPGQWPSNLIPSDVGRGPYDLPLSESKTNHAADAKGHEFIWLEGEQPTSANMKVQASGWGNAQFLSEGKWIHFSIDADKVDHDIPDSGIILKYEFQSTRKTKYQLWSRIGFEFARSPFDWRLDHGPWNRLSPDALTTDLMEIAHWCEVAWLQMGDASLDVGEHILEIRLPKIKNDDGTYQRILFACDSICLFAGQFNPHSKVKPNDDARDAIDREASETVFQLPETRNPAARASVALAGLWEVCRDDEQSPGPVAEPLRAFPDQAHWKAIAVPGDKNKLRPDLIFAHRLWYRTRVAVPESMAGRAFYLDFPCNNLNTTVYVNGLLCGFEKNPFVPFQIDVTAGIHAGETNEILVGIRDVYYGRSADPTRPMKLRRTFNIPLSNFSDGFQDLDYPVWNCPQSGILGTPTLVAAGGVYVSDIFIKPSTANKCLEIEITLTNTTSHDAQGEIQWSAVDEKTGDVEHSFAAMAFHVPAEDNQVIKLSGAWDNPKLWWPDSPNLYLLRTTVVIAKKPVDLKDTLFGFREWRCEGTQFTLNGVVWHMWADLVGVDSSPEAWLEAYRNTHQRTMRLSTAGQGGHETRWLGLEPRAALEFFDRNGVVVRRNTTLDGERIGYHFSESDSETRRQQGGSEMKMELMKNWRDQCVAQVKGERNHPSIQIWTIENEFAFINLINLLGNSPLMDQYEEEIRKTHDAVLAVDPTRPVMIDGGGATKANTLGVHGDHYIATLDGRYPDLAYEPFEDGGGRGRWRWDRKRPRFIGEDWYATGINPADYAMWGGEIAFQGKAATRDAVARIYRMLNEGYRWGGHYAAWQFWLGRDGGPAQWGANFPRAVVVRQWDWTFGSEQHVLRSFGIFNDTQYPDPITFTRKLMIHGSVVYEKSSTHHVAPGTAIKFDETIAMPHVDQRLAGDLRLELRVKDQVIFQDVKELSVLPTPNISPVPSQAVALFDPEGKAIPLLKKSSIAFHKMESLDSVPASTRVVLVGPDAIPNDQSMSPRLAVLASEGHAVIVLDQSNPLINQAIPAEIQLAPRTKNSDFGQAVPAADGTTAYIEDPSHPAFLGLANQDFFTWGPDHRVFHNAYQKPTRKAKSLAQCGPRLEYSALVEVPAGKGILYLCQLDLGAKLSVNPVAQQLVFNLIRAGLDYRLEFANVATVISDPFLEKAVEAIGLKYSRAPDPLVAIRTSGIKIAFISATPAHLKQLANDPASLEAFWKRGGTLLLCGLTPEGLADFNHIVGIDHLIRPFKRERVTFPSVRNPLTAGLTVGDIVMLSGERIFGWTADEYVASDVFSYIVDLDDMAPFAKSNFGAYDNIVNGFVGSDGWPLIIDFEYPQDASPYEIHLDLPAEERIIEYMHDPSINYNPTTRIALLFDGADRLEFDLGTHGDAQCFTIDPPRPARRVTIQLVEWQTDPNKRPLIGIDHIALRVSRSPEWHATVRPMLNLGGMVQYIKGNGNVVLCNLRFLEKEAVPINQTKKQTILATILRNLKAPFSDSLNQTGNHSSDFSTRTQTP